MAYIVLSIAILLFLHKVLEGIVCASGDRAWRKLAWDWATAGVFLALVAGAWVAIVVNPGLRREWGTLLFVATPFLAGGALLFGYLSKTAYDNGQYDDLYADGDDLPDDDDDEAADRNEPAPQTP
ncbi:MAG: hypothetical protein RLY93_14165 [Sumerlaeia bacterium]